MSPSNETQEQKDVTLSKRRRRGEEDSESNFEDADSERLRFKDRVYLARLSSLEGKLERVDTMVDKELRDLRECSMKTVDEIKLIVNELSHTVKDLEKRQASAEPTIQALRKVIDSSSFMKWVFVFIMSVFAFVGGAASFWDLVNKWMKT